MGRPRKPEQEQLNTSAATKLDPQLFAEVKELSEARRWSISTFLREAARDLVDKLRKRAA